MPNSEFFGYPGAGIEMYRQQLAKYDRAFVGLEIDKHIPQLREAFRTSVKKVQETMKQKSNETVRVEDLYKEEVKNNIPKGFSFIGFGSQSNVIKTNIGGKELAIKFLYQPGEAVVDTSWDDLSVSSTDEAKMDPATQIAVGLDIAHNLSSVNKLVAYSPEEQVLITEFVSGINAFEYLRENKQIDIPDTKLSNYVRSVMESYKRGLVLDNRLENTIITPRKDLIILEFLTQLDHADDEARKASLVQAYTSISEMLRVVRIPTLGKIPAQDRAIELIGGENYIAEAEELFAIQHNK